MAENFRYPDIMSRTAFCPKCAAAGRPKKETIYITYCSSHKTYALMLHVGEKRPSVGMTPHVFMDPCDFFCPDGTHYVMVKSVCYVNGCGVILTPNKEGTAVNINMHVPEEYDLMPHKDFLNLINFKDRSMQLDCVEDLDNWDLVEIIRSSK